MGSVIGGAEEDTREQYGARRMPYFARSLNACGATME